MKIGIISDIHGNIKALDAVLNELEKENIDKIICLGDMIGGAPMSEQVVQKIMGLGDNIILVRGNRENYIIEGMPKIVHDEKIEISQEQFERHEFIKKELSDLSKDFINKIPKEKMYEVEGHKIYLSHYPMKEDGSFRKHIKQANAEENEKMFSGINADIYLYGHTHVEIYNTKDNKIYINPGALGCPGKTNSAPYGILTISKDDIKYKQLYAKYNVKEVTNYIEKVKFPGYKGVLKLFYGFDE